MSATRPATGPDSDAIVQRLFTPAFIQDPYPVYADIHAGARTFPIPGTALWISAGYEDIQRLLRDKRLGHDYEANLVRNQGAGILSEPAYQSLANMLLVKDPPDHGRLRSLVVKAFDARSIEKLRREIREIADELIDAMGTHGEGDLIRAFCFPLPVMVICRMLGLPRSQWSRFTGGERTGGRILDPTPMAPDELARANENVRESHAYWQAICQERREQPRDDLLTALVQSETAHGRLTPEELTSNIGLLFGAGHETTVNLLGNGLKALSEHPQQWAILKADLGLLPNAIEEMLRFDSSVQLTARHCFEAIEVDGQDVPEGAQIITLLGAGNRDPRIFADPDRFDVQRENVKPLSFGGGIHFCLGAQLARIEAQEALTRLFTRRPDLQIDTAAVEYQETITLRGVMNLPARW